MVRWFVADDVLGTAALRVRDQVSPHAPSLLLVETGNALQRYVRGGRITIDAACSAVRMVARRFAVTSDGELVEDAQRLASEIGHGVYDCLYACLARKLEVPLITADLMFAAKVDGRRDVQLLTLQTGWTS